MKLAEIFFGEVQAVDQLGDAVVNFLFYLREQGVTKLKTEELIPMLKQEGINDFDEGDEDSVKSLVDLLNEELPELIASATIDEISFKNSMPDAMSSSDADNAVAQAADRANPLT